MKVRFIRDDASARTCPSRTRNDGSPMEGTRVVLLMPPALKTWVQVCNRAMPRKEAASWIIQLASY